ncbi:MAG: HAMP domain-containing sensor histidine kinase [Rubrivivax sp.]|nr:HAMP domain-containing sensor histidine kinase [Rubrivivax sp.]
MLSKLPYRLQIPLGLSIAVVLAAALVTVVAAQIAAARARDDILARIDRGASLLVAQALPMLAADDTWRVYVLLRDTVPLLPGAAQGLGRAAVLDAEGRVFAASDPLRLPTGLPPADSVRPVPGERAGADGGWTVLRPVRSEDGQQLGYVHVQVDAPVFAPDWAALAQPALFGGLLAIALLVPAGWWLGRRMAWPVASMARTIDRIGRDPPAALQDSLPRSADPELGRIAEALERLIGEQQRRQTAEQRALAAERLAAVGRLTATVAHELNNPLAGLRTATRTLALHGHSDAQRRRTLDLLERGLGQMQATLAALLPQARLQARALELDDFEDVLTLVQPMFSQQTVSLEPTIDVDSALRVPADAVRQVMLNLLLNAAKAAGPGGTVQARLQADAERVHFSVAHGGEVLSAAALRTWLTSENSSDPRGFGLWVCHEIATRFDGGFEVDAGHAPGTRLVFWMPNRERDATPAAD